MGQAWSKPEWPTVGDRLALHIFTGKGCNSPVSALYVGPEPWGKGGKLNGRKILNGRLIANAPLGDASFDHFMLRVAQSIAQMNLDTEIGAQTVELVLSLQSRGVNSFSAPRHCINCDQPREPNTFTKATAFSWAVNRSDRPKFIGNSCCVVCYHGRLSAFESVLASAYDIVKRHKGVCDDILLSGEIGTIYPADIVAIIDPKHFLPKVIKLKKFVKDIEDGKV